MSEQKTVKLGLMPPLTGLVGIYGEEISRAGQVACAEVNANGGVLGKPLELVIEDDGSLPDSAVVAARKLVDEHHCAAIIGNLLSNSRIAVAYQVAEPRKIPLLNFSFYEGSIQSRYFFHFAALPNQQIDRMIPYMREKYGPRMFFAGNNYEWPRGSIDAAKRALLLSGGEVVGEEYCPIGVPENEIERLLDLLEAAAPDVFVPYFAGADQVNLLTRFTRRGLKKRMAVVMGHYDEMMASILPPEVREDFYSSNTYFMSVDTKENRNYLAQLEKLPGVTGLWPKGNGILTNFGEGTYLCVKAFAQAANQAGSVDPEALVEVLRSIQLSGPQGSVRMDPASHHAAVNTYLTRCEADGRFNIVEKFGVLDPLIPERYNHQRIGNQATLEDDIRLQARILEQMSEAVILVNAGNGQIVYTNYGADRLFGYDKGELHGLSIAAMNDPAEGDPQKIAAEIVLVLDEKGAWQGEVKNIKKDGTAIWCSSSISTFTHPVHGEVWLWVQHDITERKLGEQALLREATLKQSEQRSRAIIEASPVPLAINDAVGNITFLNQAFTNTLGYKLSDIPDLATWWPLAYPDPQYRQQVADKWGKNLEVAQQANQPFAPLELDICCKNGDKRTFIASAAALEKGFAGDHLVILYDITGRKKTEQILFDSTARMNEAQRIAQIGHWELNLPGGKLIWSDEIFRIFEIDQAKFAASYEAFLNAIHPDDRDAVNRAYTHSLATRESYEITHRLLMKDGRIKWVLEKCSSTFDSAGAPVQSRGMVQDITKMKLAELTLIAARDEAERANAAKSEFLSRMSHELRTPLNAILGFGQLLVMGLADPLSEQQRSNVNEIVTAGNNLLALINEILDLSRIENGHLKIKLEPISVQPMIRACVAQLHPLALQKKITISPLPVTRCAVLGDVQRLREVLENLLSNAIKYNRAGGEVHISCSPASGQHLRISVRDSGRGIPAGALPRLFKPFERLESAYDGIEGSGIGLALAKKLVEAMHGEIGVDSEQGVGSTFWFELPLAPDENAEADATDSNLLQTGDSRRKLLYVEDNTANVKLMRKLLDSRLDINMLVARNAEEGIEIAKQLRPDMILLDIQLPGMDGFEALKLLRKNPQTRNIPVIAVTSNAMKRDIERGREAGFNDYLTKPIDVSKFFGILESILATPGKDSI